ncbi:MAG TPA: hypothetical protein VFX61_22090 [Micromonosporaceae bacterium]|nr:hypothetical protein [Micromonosporaceae bacterium]
MRLTVGPLPPAVYWRRRAAVLGVVLLFVLIVSYSCSGSKKSVANPDATLSPEATVTIQTPTSDPPSDKSSNGDSSSDGSSSGDSSDGEPTGTSDETAGTPSTDTAGAAGTCTDEEILVTPVPSRNPVQRGVTIELRLKIKNVSSRTCDRDVGADAQEVYISLGAEKIWSSDTCGTAHGTKVVTLPPAMEHMFTVAWNGKASTSCAKGVATGEVPKAGEYQLFGRLATKYSEPVRLTITN